MQVIRGDLTAPVRVTDQLSVHGRLRAGAVVASGAQLLLHGLSEGDIVIEPGGTAEVWGIIERSIVNRGGTVRVYGLVSGDVSTTDDGTTCISDDFIVRGTRSTS